VLAIATSANAQDLTYTPINPSFGGNAFNSSHLLGVAGAQKPEKKTAVTCP
jgi:curli production assembly/transport component CsgF